LSGGGGLVDGNVNVENEIDVFKRTNFYWARVGPVSGMEGLFIKLYSFFLDLFSVRRSNSTV
jgi:hypothetical protein